MLKRLALLYILLMLALLVGFMTGRYETFPYSYISTFVTEVERFVFDTSNQNTTLIGKIATDLNIKPDRFIYNYPSRNINELFTPLNLADLNPRREQPEIFKTPQPDGFYLIYGVFDFSTALHGAILLDNKFHVVHTWKFPNAVIQSKDTRDSRAEQATIIDALSILDDGSLVTVFDFPGITKRFDWCGNEQWQLPGHSYHHSVELDDTQTTGWTWRDWEPDELKLVHFKTATGEILREIYLSDIMKANPDVDIFNIRENDEERTWLYDPIHGNDIEPLSQRLASHFPQFSSGDLLISMRSLDLVFVMNPQDLKVMWWRIGQTRRQHDPDWQNNGKISIFDNRMHRDYSRIIEIDPKTFQSSTLFDGKPLNVYTELRGRHQKLPNGNLLITVPHQGRVLEVNQQGKVVFDFFNTYEASSGSRLEITGAEWLPPNYFKSGILTSCAPH